MYIVGRGFLFYEDPPYVAYPSLSQILSDTPLIPTLFLALSDRVTPDGLFFTS